MNILIVEDDAAIRNLIDINLQMVGNNTFMAENSNKAEEILKLKDIDLVLLDVMIPGISGFELIEIIKARDIPVIFITARDSVMDKVKGLRLGADDYIVKPFEIIELVARIEVVARRYEKNQKIINFKHVEIDVNKRLVKSNDKVIDLTLKEFELLLMFIRNKNIALTREQLLEGVWGFDYMGETRTIDIHVQRLRDKLLLKDDIKTIFKVGYRLQD